MNKFFPVTLFCLFLLLASRPNAVAQTIISPVDWNSSGASSTDSSNFSSQPATTTPGAGTIFVSQWNRGPGTAYNTAGSSYNSNTWCTGSTLAAAQSGGNYVYFIIANNSSVEMKISQIVVESQVSSTGPRTVEMTHSTGTSGDISYGSAASTAHSGSPETFTFTQDFVICSAQADTFKLYGYGATGTAGTLRINNATSLYDTFATSMATTATSTSPVCAGGTLSFTGTYSGGVSGYTLSWHGPSGFTSTSATPSITSATVAATGTYSFTVTDRFGCSSTATTAATVNASVTAGITPTSAAICTGGSATLTATGGTSGSTYQWYIGTTPVSGATNATYTASPSATTSYNVHITPPAGCVGISSPVTVTVGARPAAAVTYSGSLTFCAPATINLNGTSGTGYTYQWLNSGTPIGGANSATYAAGTTGNYSVIIAVGTCADTSTAVAVTVNPQPASATITASSATTFCANDSVSLSVATGTGYTYQWSNGTAIAGATNSSYTAHTSGTYSVTVTNGFGCNLTSATGAVITTNPLPAPTITAFGPTSFCTGGSVTLSATGGGFGGFTYQWYDSSTAIAGANTRNYTATNTGVYSVIVSNSTTGCSSDVAVAATDAVTVTVGARPSGTITPTGTFTICSNDSVVLTAPSGSGYTYQWSRNSGSGYAGISGATNVTYGATLAGSYRVSVSLGTCSSFGGTAVNINVNAAPSSVLTLTGAVTFCIGDSIVMTAPTGTGYAYQWFEGATPGATTSIAGATTNRLAAYTTGYYKVNITAPNGCTSSSAATLVTSVDRPTVVASGPSKFCVGGSVLLTTTIGSAASGVVYQWKKNSANIVGATTSTLVVNTSGSYSVFVNIPGSCATTTDSFAIIVTQAPNPVITFDGAHFSTSPFFATYQWYLNTVTIPGATNPTLTAYNNGIYRVMVSDTNGCSKLSSAFQLNNLEVYNVNQENDIKVIPNPTNNFVRVETLAQLNVTIYSLEGKIVNTSVTNMDIDVSSLANGIYLIYINDEKGRRLKVEKLMKQ